MKRLFFPVFMILTCTFCKRHELSKADEIHLKFKWDDIKLSDMIDTVVYVPLETNEESLIGEISQIFFQQNLYYVFDRQQKKVIIFDEKGRYITKLNYNGKGPCEYEYIHDIYVDEQGIIKILSVSDPIKIIEYDIANQSCSETLFRGLAGSSFYPYGDGYLFFLPNGDERLTNRFFLFVVDSTGKVLDKWLPSHSYVGYSLMVNAFSSYKDTILFNKHFDNHIYQILPNKDVSVRYTLNFGKYQIPDDVKKLFQENFDDYLRNSDDYILKLDFFYETSNLLVFSYLTYQGDSPFFALFMKDKKELMLLKPKDDVGIAISNPINLLEDDFFISFLEVSEFLHDKSPPFQKYRDRIYQTYLGLKAAVDTLSETSNPVLIKYKFKSP